MSIKKNDVNWPENELQKIKSERDLDVSEKDIQAVADAAKAALQATREQLQRGAERQ